jgi:hypothetical protein
MPGNRWWIVAVAALLLLIITVHQSIGLATGAGLAVAICAGIAGSRYYRQRHPAKGPEVYCLRCGKTLALTARNCKFCGSASWSMKN